jgi:hypothetical protein
MKNFMREAQTIENLKNMLNEQDLSTIIRNDFFRNTLDYPTQEIFQVRKICEHCGSTYSDKEAWNKFTESRSEYQAEENRLYFLFRDSLFLNHNIEITDKGKSMFNIAWGRGHSSGIHDVYICFEEMVDIL